MTINHGWAFLTVAVCVGFAGCGAARIPTQKPELQAKEIPQNINDAQKLSDKSGQDFWRQATLDNLIILKITYVTDVRTSKLAIKTSEAFASELAEAKERDNDALVDQLNLKIVELGTEFTALTDAASASAQQSCAILSTPDEMNFADAATVATERERMCAIAPKLIDSLVKKYIESQLPRTAL